MKPRMSKQSNSTKYVCTCLDEDVPDTDADIDLWWMYSAIGFGHTMEDAYYDWCKDARLDEYDYENPGEWGE